VDIFQLATITNQLCSPQHRELWTESMQHGLDLRVVYMIFLTETRQHLDRSYGPDSPLGRLVESMYQQTVASSDFSQQDVKDMKEQTWPKLEAVAKSVDVLQL
jgi:SET and MYND domain-containing protein